MKTGSMQDLVLVAQEAQPVGRQAKDGALEEGYYVDLVHVGDRLPALVVYGTTLLEARARAQQVLDVLKGQRRVA